MRLKPATGFSRSPRGFSGLNEKIGPVCTRLASTDSAAHTSSTGAISETKVRIKLPIQALLSGEGVRSAELTNRSWNIWPSSRQADAPQIIASASRPQIMINVLKSRLLATWPCLRASSSLKGVACSVRFCSCSATGDPFPEVPGGLEQRRQHRAREFHRDRETHEAEQDLHREAQHEHVELRDRKSVV